jgi:hypothetical protein
MALQKIVSGGQTGADRAALDAALEAGFPCGGCCPPGRTAEDGIIHERYPLMALTQGGYRQRTLRNVLDSDGTAIFYFEEPQGGTELTLAFCIKHKKPYKLIDAEEVSEERAAQMIKRCIEAHAVLVLNVAGPRLSRSPRIYAYTYETIRRLLSVDGINDQSGR